MSGKKSVCPYCGAIVWMWLCQPEMEFWIQHGDAELRYASEWDAPLSRWLKNFHEEADLRDQLKVMSHELTTPL